MKEEAGGVMQIDLKLSPDNPQAQISCVVSVKLHLHHCSHSQKRNKKLKEDFQDFHNQERVFPSLLWTHKAGNKMLAVVRGEKKPVVLEWITNNSAFLCNLHQIHIICLCLFAFLPIAQLSIQTGSRGKHMPNSIS